MSPQSDLHGTRSLLCKLAGGKGVVLSRRGRTILVTNVHLLFFHFPCARLQQSLFAGTAFQRARAAMASIADRRIYKKPARRGLKVTLDVVANAELLDEFTVLKNVAVLDVNEQDDGAYLRA